MEEIKYPTGNFEIDWLLEKPNRALEENSLSNAIKYLIEKHNELVRALAEISHENSGLNIPPVINPVCDCMFQDWYVVDKITYCKKCNRRVFSQTGL